ncbi:MAG: hypothetical protein HW421_1929 [Ignavibacteria bacterium]|nr:hypothetical protein [Ignavibacteria bacterium]
MNLKIQIPDKLYKQAMVFANNNNFKIEDFINYQFIANLEGFLINQINERAKNVNREDFERILAKVPDVEPNECDRL